MKQAATRTTEIVAKFEPLLWEPGMGFGVVIDTREQRPWDFRQLTPIKIEALPAGDYSIVGHETEIALERKSLQDYVNCSVVEYSGRFGAELDKLADYDFAAIVVEADIRDVHLHRYHSKVAPTAVLSRAASITATRGIPVIFAGSHVHAADFGHRLLRRWFEHRVRGAMA
jgi:ERCC4-type nuclease